jgi:hypothetical protein
MVLNTSGRTGNVNTYPNRESFLVTKQSDNNRKM